MGAALAVAQDAKAWFANQWRSPTLNIPYRVPILRYGYTWRGDGIRCASSFNGMTCTTGAHGFFINRTKYRLW